MAWALTLSLVLGSIVLLTYLHRAIQKLRRNAFVYPSEATIDQLIPPEIMEQIIFNCDYETLMACSVVSKYWHYHASKDFVQDHVFRTDNSLALSADELKELFKHAARFEPDSIQQGEVSRPDNYPPKYRVADQYFAKQLKTKLLETNLSVARGISHVMNNDPAIQNYLVKLRCRCKYGWADHWSLEDIPSTHYFSIDAREVPDCQQYEYTRGLECDVIMDLKAVWNAQGDFTNGIKRLRVLDNRPNVAGFPLSSAMIQLLVVLILPCLLVDYLHSTAHEVKFYAKIIFALIFEFSVVFIAIKEHIPYDDGSPAVAKKRRNGTLIGLGIILIGVVFYRWSLELALFVALLAGCTLYYFIWETFIRKRYKNAKLVGAIAVCLIILMNDWKLTVDVFKSGIILKAFLYNTMMIIQLAMIFTLHNALVTHLRSCGYTWKDYLIWRLEYKLMFAHGLLGLVFVTLYAPLTTNKIF